MFPETPPMRLKDFAALVREVYFCKVKALFKKQQRLSNEVDNIQKKKKKGHATS